MGAARYLPDYDDDDAATLFPAHGTGIGNGIGGSPRNANPNAFTELYGTPDDSGPRSTVRPPSKSIVRLRVPATDVATRKVLRDLGDRQIAFAASLSFTHARVAALPHDSSTRAAAVTLLARIADLGDVRDALNELYRALARRDLAREAPCVSGVSGADESESSGRTLLSPGEPLAIHLDGIYRWLLGTSEALSILAEELLSLQADWWIFRLRLGDAKKNHAEAMAPAVRATLWALTDEAMRTDLTAAFDDLSFALRMLESNLDQRFG